MHRNSIVAIEIPLYFIYYKGYWMRLSRLRTACGPALFAPIWIKQGVQKINLFGYLYVHALNGFNVHVQSA